jgi:hypothetical protein
MAAKRLISGDGTEIQEEFCIITSEGRLTGKDHFLHKIPATQAN